MITAVIPYRNEREALTRLLRSLPNSLPVIVIDDQSDVQPDTQAIGEIRRTHPDIRIWRTEERGYFAGAVNVGIERCDTDVLVLNQDIWFEVDGWLDQLAELSRDYAMIGDGVFGHPAWPQGYVQGTFMYLRRDAINAVGLLNEVDFPLWGCTAEWQIRACRRGFRAHPMALDWFKHGREGAYGKSIAQALKEEPKERDLFIRTPPLISLVVPCYNYGKYLPDLIASLIGGDSSLGKQSGQTFSAFDVTIVDDVSTDDSAEIAKGLADDWKGVHFVQMPKNGGTARAINTGISKSYGRYVLRIDADDMLRPDALEKMYRQAAPNRLVYSWAQHFYNGKLGAVQMFADYNFETLLSRNMVPAGALFTRAAWNKVGGYPEIFQYGREDWAMAIALGEIGICGHRIAEPLYLYRNHPNSRSHKNTNLEWRTFFLDQLKTRFPNLYKGDWPVGCCGGSRSAAPVKIVDGVAKAAPLAGATGMVLLEYIGSNVGRTAWRGPVTGTRYIVKGSRRIIYVDAQDVDGMLAIVYSHKPAFRRYKAPPPVVEPGIQPIEGGINPAVTAEEAEVIAATLEPAAEEVGASIEAEKPKRSYRRKAVEEAV